MKLLKRTIIGFIILLAVLSLGYVAAWYYITVQLTSTINRFVAERSQGIDNNYLDELYSGKKQFKQDDKYFKMAELGRIDIGDFAALLVRNVKAKAYGFPFTIGVEIEGLEEEWFAAMVHVRYQQPIRLSYNLFSQNLTLSYSGDAKMTFHKGASGKVVDFFDITDLSYELDAIVKHGKPRHMQLRPQSATPVKLKINDFSLSLNVPLNKQLFNDVRAKQYGGLLNQINKVQASCKALEYYDLDNDEVLYYSIKDSTGHIKFTPRKKYTSIEDFQSNIPGNWQLKFKVDRIADAASNKHKLFRNWHGGDSYIKLDLSNSALNFKNISTSDFSLDAILKHKFKLIDIEVTKLKLEQKKNRGVYKRNMLISSNMLPRQGFIKSVLQDKNLHKFLNEVTDSDTENYRRSEIAKRSQFLLDNYDSLKLHEIENSQLIFNCDIDSETNGQKRISQIQNLEMLSEEAGFAIKGEIVNENVKGNKQPFKDITATGELVVRHYDRVVDNLAMFFYHYSKMPKKLLKQIWPTYFKANKIFFRSIASNAKGHGPHLIYRFDFDSKPPYKAQLGQVDLRNFDKVYKKFMTNNTLDKILDVKELQQLRDFLEDTTKLKKNLPKHIPKEVKNFLDKVKDDPKLKKKLGPLLDKDKEKLLKKLF